MGRGCQEKKVFVLIIIFNFKPFFLSVPVGQSIYTDD